MSVIINGDTGITSPAETVQGALTTTGNTILGDASTDTLNVGNGGLVKDASGNVGIGTSSPGNKLTALSTSTTATLAKFGAANYGNLGTTYIEIGTEYVDGGSRIGNINPAGNFGTLVFETMTGVSGVFAERMRIDSSGNLLFNSGYGSAATAYGCRAWVNFNGTGTVAIRASGNVSSITDNGVGDYTVNFTTAMSDANYSVAGTCVGGNGSSNSAQFVSSVGTGVGTSSSAVRISTKYSQTAANNDVDTISVQVFR